MPQPRFHLPSLSRRHWLQWMGVAGAGAGLAGCQSSASIGATFFQPWDVHLSWSRERWRQSLQASWALGCSEVFVQWVGLEGDSPSTWDARAPMIQSLLDEAADLGMGVHLGLPYDPSWWKSIAATDDRQVRNYLQGIAQRCVSYMASVSWAGHRAFQGWYIPYELEQYHWAPTPRVAMLQDWLAQLYAAAARTGDRIPTISTYYSEMAPAQSLASLWDSLLDAAPVHVMVQDGVGVHGLGNYKNLEPLHQLLLARKASFDVVLELFERLPQTANVQGEFKAKSAPFTRVAEQARIASDYGARRLVAFALEPWVLGQEDCAAQLQKAWRDAIGSRT